MIQMLFIVTALTILTIPVVHAGQYDVYDGKRWCFNCGVGYAHGGDKIAYELTSDEIREIRLGSGMIIYIAGVYRLPKLHSRLQLSVGCHVNMAGVTTQWSSDDGSHMTIGEINHNVDIRRFPIDMIALREWNRFMIGAGATYHWKMQENFGHGSQINETVNWNGALGYLAELNCFIYDRYVRLNLRRVWIDYESPYNHRFNGSYWSFNLVLEAP